VSRNALKLSLAMDSSSMARLAGDVRGSELMLAVDNDLLTSPRLMVVVASASGSPRNQSVIAATGCRTAPVTYACRDSAHAEVANGRFVVTVRDSAMIAWLFAERPAAVWVHAPVARARTGYVDVAYIDPQLATPAMAALVRQDSIAASDGWGPWTRMMWTSSFAALDPVWMQIGEQARAYLGEMQCRPIDSCNYRTDFSASKWTSSDSTVARVVPTDNPRQVEALITALRPGRSTVTVAGVHGPSDELPRSTRVHEFTRHIVVTNRLARIQITPRPTTIRAGSRVTLNAQLVDEFGAILPDAPINFVVIYDWPDNKSWSQKRYDLATRADLTTPGHRRFIANLRGLADTLDLEVVPAPPLRRPPRVRQRGP